MEAGEESDAVTVGEEGLIEVAVRGQALCRRRRTQDIRRRYRRQSHRTINSPVICRMGLCVERAQLWDLACLQSCLLHRTGGIILREFHYVCRR